MIAGENILYYPGTYIEEGGYLHGSISPGGPWCVLQPKDALFNGTGETLSVTEQQFYRIYPNPTSGNFMLELNAQAAEKYLVEIYDMKGDKMLSAEMRGERRHEFSLSGKPVGIYLVRVISERNSGTTRIIKQ
jgi:hypothetical protein